MDGESIPSPGEVVKEGIYRAELEYVKFTQEPIDLLTNPITRLIHNFSEFELTYKEVIIVFTVAIFLFNFYINQRQYRKYQDYTFTTSVQQLVETEKEFRKSQDYGQAKSRYGFFKDFFWFIYGAAMLVFDAHRWVWVASGVVLDHFGVPKSEIYQSFAYVFIYSFPGMILGIPFSLYYNFSLEESFGFNKMTIKTFIGDFFKNLLVETALGVPVIAGSVAIIRWIGTENMPLICGGLWSFIVVVHTSMLIIYPFVIQPIFNKFTPLKEGTLRTRIEALAKKIGFPLYRLLVQDASRRSGHSNAYMYGFGKSKRIVLFDTLLEQLSEDECLAVLAHELGHWKLKHILIIIGFTHTYSLVMLSLFGLVFSSPEFAEAFGFGPSPAGIHVPGWNGLSEALQSPAIPIFLLFNGLLGPVDTFISFAWNAASRRMEFAADNFSIKLGYGEHLITGLKSMHAENAAALKVDKLYATMHYSHPPLVQRLENITAKAKEIKQD